MHRTRSAKATAVNSFRPATHTPSRSTTISTRSLPSIQTKPLHRSLSRSIPPASSIGAAVEVTRSTKRSQSSQSHKPDDALDAEVYSSRENSDAHDESNSLSLKILPNDVSSETATARRLKATFKGMEHARLDDVLYGRLPSSEEVSQGGASATSQTKRQAAKKEPLTAYDDGDDGDDGDNAHDENNADDLDSKARPNTPKQRRFVHEQVLRLYLENYDQQENLEMEDHYTWSQDQDTSDRLRAEFIISMFTSLNPKQYDRFVHNFRTLLLRLRSLLSRREQLKSTAQDEGFLQTETFEERSGGGKLKQIDRTFRADVTVLKSNFFRSSVALFGSHADLLMPQLVVHLSKITVAQLEAARDRLSTSKMNKYSAGFFQAEVVPAHERHGMSEDDLYNQQLSPTAANKLYEHLDIHTDMTSPLLWSKLTHLQKEGHKVFVNNIPVGLTTRELMSLFGACGILKGCEIYRTRVNDNIIDVTLSRKEALAQANIAALTADLAEISLGSFTASFKSDISHIPRHLLEANTMVDPASPSPTTPEQTKHASTFSFAEDEFNKVIDTSRTLRNKTGVVATSPQAVNVLTAADGQEVPNPFLPEIDQKQNKTPNKPLSERFKLRTDLSPVYGFLYFATEEGKKRALHDSVQIFGVSTSTGITMTTRPVERLTSLVVSGIRTNMRTNDVLSMARTILQQSQLDPSTLLSSNVPLQKTAGGYNTHDRRNRGYAVLNFDTHESAFKAFKYLNHAPLVWPPAKNRFHTKNVDDDGLLGEEDGITFGGQADGSEATQQRLRTLTCNWVTRVTRANPKESHPITSYFPTSATKSRVKLYQVSRDLEKA